IAPGHHGTHAKTGRSVIFAAISQAHTYGINTIAGRDTAAHAQICSRKAELPTQLLAMCHAATDAVRTPQQALCAWYVADGQCGAYARAAGAGAADFESRHRRDNKAAGCAKRAQPLHVTFTATGKVKVLANDDMAHVQSFQQQLLHEILGVQRRKLTVEA